MFSSRGNPQRQPSKEVIYRRNYSQPNDSESPENPKRALKIIAAPLNQSEEESDDEFVRDGRIQIERERVELEEREREKGKGKGKGRKKSATPVKVKREVKREESPIKRSGKYRSDSSGEDERILVAPKLYVHPLTTGKLAIPENHIITPSGLNWQARSDNAGPQKKKIKLSKEIKDDKLERDDEIRHHHVKGTWRSKWNKAHPECVPADRIELEKKYNPLVNLLGAWFHSFSASQSLIRCQFTEIELRIENERENGSDRSNSDESEDDGGMRGGGDSASEAEESDGKGGIVKPKAEPRDIKPSFKTKVSRSHSSPAPRY